MTVVFAATRDVVAPRFHRGTAQRPRLLWIPHTSWSHCRAQRPWFLIHALKARFEIHVATWAARPATAGRSYYLNPLNHLRALQTDSAEEEFGFVHDVGVPLPVMQYLVKGYPSDRVLAFSQRQFQRNLGKLQRRWNFDAAVVSASHHFTGYPPRFDAIPCVFDYVDMSPPDVERKFIERADSVICVSRFLKNRVSEHYKRESVWIPNGLRLDKMASANRSRGRARWGLEGRRVVSLIGLTCSDRLYFLDALAVLARESPDIIFVAAGSGAMAEKIRARATQFSVPVIMTGWVEPDDVPDLFAASDVGLYPGDDSDYFAGACPLKVLEYAGAGVPVVANRTAELQSLNFPGLVLCSATANDFVVALREAFKKPRMQAPEIAAFDWNLLAARFGDEVERTISEKAQLAGPR